MVEDEEWLSYVCGAVRRMFASQKCEVSRSSQPDGGKFAVRRVCRNLAPSEPGSRERHTSCPRPAEPKLRQIAGSAGSCLVRTIRITVERPDFPGKFDRYHYSGMHTLPYRKWDVAVLLWKWGKEGCEPASLVWSLSQGACGADQQTFPSFPILLAHRTELHTHTNTTSRTRLCVFVYAFVHTLRTPERPPTPAARARASVM